MCGVDYFVGLSVSGGVTGAVGVAAGTADHCGVGKGTRVGTIDRSNVDIAAVTPDTAVSPDTAVAADDRVVGCLGICAQCSDLAGREDPGCTSVAAGTAVDAVATASAGCRAAGLSALAGGLEAAVGSIAAGRVRTYRVAASFNRDHHGILEPSKPPLEPRVFVTATTGSGDSGDESATERCDR